jgi:hypothetical protein
MKIGDRFNTVRFRGGMHPGYTTVSGHIVSFDEETISFLDEDTEKLSFTPRSYYCENYAAASALAKKLTEEHLSKYTPLWEKKG